ncbi:acireductone synthase [Halotalea alkalilenta]|uniref:acireductone synthase n=1 Tax=Halotalea alkalilenta TaxID=376489 RepID=UPI0005BB77D8|nr:acireductone synthase [Halotalea alkalilenta]
MSADRPLALAPHAIVTDIEGTTGSIHFVHRVLFPYARRHLAEWLELNAAQPAVAEQLELARLEAGEPDASVARLGELLGGWIDQDRKSTPLKALQGMIWERGYLEGDFKGHVYMDAAERLRTWHGRGIALYVYSSGSIHAQKLLFGHSEAGDLTGLFSGYFDTTTGPKREAESYRAIQREIGAPGGEILFLSDVVEELDAAREAGLRTVQLVRKPGMRVGDHPCVERFDQISFD